MNIIEDIGGVLALLFVVGLVLSKIFNDAFMKAKIISKIYHIESKRKPNSLNTSGNKIYSEKSILNDTVTRQDDYQVQRT